jgi:hypothetical protein
MLTVALVYSLSVLQGFGFAIGMLAGIYSMFAIASRFNKQTA